MEKVGSERKKSFEGLDGKELSWEGLGRRGMS